MSKVFALYHIVFATSRRQPSLHGIDRQSFHRVIVNIAGEKNSKVICINSVDDHLHLLVNLSATVSLSAFMNAIKAKSSSWVKHHSNSKTFTSCCSGYYACTVSPSMMKKSIAYIESQQEHHQRMNFDNEMRRIFEKLGLEYHPDELT